MDKKKVPQLRFQGFCEEWERKKGDLVTFVVDNRGKTPPLSDKGIPLIEIASVGNYKVDYSQVTKWVSEITFQESLRNYLEEGDILFSTVGSTGLCSFYEVRIKAVVAQNIIGLRFSGDNSVFMLCLLQVPRNSSHIKSIQMNGVQGSIKVPQLLNLYFQISTNIAEQTQIGTLFQNLDTLLTTKKQEHENLLQLKKAMLTKLFPQKGQTVPDVRFQGFEGEYQQKEANKIFITLADKGFPDLPVLSATQEFGMVMRTDTGINIHHDKSNEIGYKRVQKGNFVMHLRSFQGGFAHSAVEGITSPAYTLLAFSDESKHDDYYWKYIFSSQIFIKSLELITYGIRDGRSINYTDFAELSFYYPNKEEQTLIGNYFQALDKRISLQENEIKTLENLKKALLDKLFVS